MARKPMTWIPRAVKRTKSGKLLLVLEMSNGGKPTPPSEKMKYVLQSKGLWLPDLTKSQCFWIYRWAIGAVKVAVKYTKAEAIRLKTRKKVTS